MRYVVAGYAFILIVLAVYAVQLVWRRRRLAQAVARVAGPVMAPVATDPAAGTVTEVAP